MSNEKKSITVKENVFSYLDSLVVCDKDCMAQLLSFRVNCNDKLAEARPTSVSTVLNEDGTKAYSIGLIGILNTISQMEDPNTDETIKFLNNLIELDTDAIRSLMGLRVNCNTELMNHATACVVCDEDSQGNPKNPRIGVFGAINGVFGIGKDGWHYLAMEMDEDGSLHRFLETPGSREDEDEDEE